jgi:uncharacterized membrane protein
MRTAVSAPPGPSRLAYLDVLRGVALVAMVVNHTARDWVGEPMTLGRYRLIYLTQAMAAPTFLFLAGFCLPLAVRADALRTEPLSDLARRFVPRGLRVVAAGLLLNVAVLGYPVLSGGVLQTIGLGVATMGLALWLLRFRGAAQGLLVAAAAGYVGFVWAFPVLTRFVADHPLLGRMLFFDYPPWPWLSLTLLGLVCGWKWLEVHRASPEAGARAIAAAALVGVLMVVAFFAYDWWMATPMRFGMRRDFILNRHWTPRGVSLLWILGTLAVLFAAAYWLIERRRVAARWLVALGQTALFLYFAHQVIEYTLVKQWLGWRVEDWPWFWLANALFLVVVVAMGVAWREMRKWAPWRRRRVLPSTS